MANNVDPAIKYTDDEIKELDKKIKDIYSEAEADIQKKMDDFNAKFQKKDAEFQKQLKDKLITQKEYDAWKKGQVFTGKQWKLKKDEMSMVLHNSNKVATAIINKSMFGVFSENSNYMAYSMEHTAGVNFGFGLYNTDAVARLIKDDPQILPKWKVNAAKDYVWNQQNLNRAITQGIIQGESLNKISKRVSTGLSAKNENLMKTFAKTAMTEAQNAGRLERMREGKALGIDVKKKWVAVLDERTRLNHRELDGQIIDIDEPFEVGGLKIMYPGDKTAHPSMVYNCRCKLDEYFPKYPSKYNRYDNIDGVPVKGMSYNEWKKAKENGENIKPVSFKKPTKKKSEDVVNKLANVTKKVINKQEAIEILKKMFTDVDDEKLLKLNETLVVDNVNQINTLNARFEAIKNNGSYFSVNSSKKAVAYAQGGFRDGKCELSISDKFYKKIDDYIAEKEKAKESFWCMPFDDSQLNVYTITHEYGHILEAEISRSRFDFDDFKEKNSMFNLALQSKELYKEEKKQAKKIMGEILDIAKENNANFDIEKNLSRYGRTNDFEAFAEIFANSQLGAPNELGLAMQQ